MSFPSGLIGRNLLLAGAALCSLCMANAAAAQASAPAPTTVDPQAADAQNSDPGSGLTDIIVTAQRRSESAQRVPIAVTAFNAADLAKSGVTSSADLPSVVPGLTISPTGARSPIFLRGVGNNGTSTSPSVLTFIDGVYQAFDGSGTDFNNIQALEVVKGPQGTLFGRNATGGVIQITTRDPTQNPTADIQLGYANYDNLLAKAYLATGIADGVAIDLAGFYDNQRNGWGTNLATDEDVYTGKRYGIRSKLVAHLSADWTANLILDYSSRRGSVGVGISQPVGLPFLYNYVEQRKYTLPTPYDVNANFGPLWRVREGGAALRVEGRVAGVKLLSITSYRRDKEESFIDYDGGPEPFFDLYRRDRRNVLTQELQIASDSGEAVQWVAGLYYYRMRSIMDPFRFGGIGGSVVFGAPPGAPFDIYADDKTKAYAAYAQATAEILPATNLTLGARYTIEKRTIFGYDIAGAIIPASVGTESKTFRKPNFRVALDHRFTRDVLGYVSWSRGFNAGFFNQISIAGFNEAVNPVVQPETIDAYEVGIKSELLNRRLRVNASAFWYKYNNLQQQVYRQGAVFTVNAAKARIRGLDLDILAQPIRRLTLSVNVNYLDATYRSYPEATRYAFLPSGPFVSSSADARGKRVINAPKWGLQLSGTYTIPTDIGSFDSTVNVNYRSTVYFDPFNEFPVRDRTLLGVTEQWTAPDGKTSLSAWAKNLTNKAYDVSYTLLTPVGPTAQPGAPRTYGVTLGRKF